MTKKDQHCHTTREGGFATLTRKGCQLVPEHGNATDARSKQKCPGLQDLHVVAPSASWKVPAAQLVHLSCAVASDVYEPALQAEAAILWVGQNAPFAHGWHWLPAWRWVELLKRPPSHGSGALLPAGQ